MNALDALLVRIIPSSSTITSSCSKRQVVVISTVLLAASFWLYNYENKKKKRRQGRPYPPGPKGLPFLGNLLDFPDASKGGQLDRQLLEWSKEYGLIFTLYVPFAGAMIICADPDMVQHVAVTRNFHKSAFTYKYLRPVLGSESMVTLEGKEWASKRKAFNPGFSPAFLKTMVATMVDKLKRCMACIDEDIDRNEPTNMLVRAQTFTSDVIATIAFGEDWGGIHPHPARLWLSKIAELSQELMFRPMLALFGFWHKWEIKRYERMLDGEMRAILERRLEEDGQTSCDDSKGDICSLAINEIKREKGALSEQDKLSISHQLKTFYFAGHDTTAILIAWAVWLLSLHDQVLLKVRAELKQHNVWIDPLIPPTFEQLQSCIYLEAVLKETLRLYPPVGGVTRYSPDENETFNGYKIGGATVILSFYAMQHHPSLWKKPEEFIPERFLDGSEDRIAAKFLAFSRGPRDCIGKYFAILEAKLAVSALVTAYDEIECVNPLETICSQLTNLPMNGAQIRFHRRREPL